VTKSFLRGHEIEFVNGEWVYCDTKEPTATSYNNRPCGHCEKEQTKEGHDGCLGTLNGIMNACCGHGQTNEAYVQFLDGHSVHGEDTMTILNILRCERDKTNN
jgi:hypothetical protein